MASRAVASPTISFGLLSIPTKAYLAAASESFSFKMVSPDGNPIKQKTFDAVTDKEIERGDCGRGHEYEPGKILSISDDEIESLAGDKSNLIEVAEFVSNSNFDPIQIEKCYYLAPDKGAEKPYRLLTRALEKMSKVAVAKWFTRGKDHLVVLKPTNGYLTMFQMYYANEVRAFDYQFSDTSEPGDQELLLAKKLINQLSKEEFSAKSFRDEFAERVRAFIDKKLSSDSAKVTAVGGTSKPNVMDLVAVLKASIQETKPEVKKASKAKK